MTAPPPLTPADCDLRDFRFMPLDVVRFAQSDLVSFAEPAAVVAALLLWGASWHQTPAGSLTDDDRTLAKLAGFGRAIGEWRAIREEALRGFVLCSDGRLYHPVVAEKAREAWQGKLKQRWRTFCSAIRMHNTRKPEDQRSAPAFEDWLEQGRPDRVAGDAKPPQQADLPLPAEPRAPAHVRVQNSCQDDEIDETNQVGDVARNGADVLRATEGDVARLNGSKGQGRDREGTGTGNLIEQPPSPPEPDPWPADLLGATQRLAAAAGVSLVQPAKLTRAVDVVKQWTADGIDLAETALPTIEARTLATPDQPVHSLAFFDTPVRKAHALRVGAARNGRTAPAPSAPVRIDGEDGPDARIDLLRKAVRTKVGERTYGTWLDQTKTTWGIERNELAVRATSPFAADWIRQHFADIVQGIASEHGIEHVAIGT